MDIDDDNKSKENQETSKENAVEKKASKKDLVGVFFSWFGFYIFRYHAVILELYFPRKLLTFISPCPEEIGTRASSRKCTLFCRSDYSLFFMARAI